MNILDTPMRVNHEAHRIYIYAPGEVCIDLTSGTQDDRERVMALLAQVQEMTHALRPLANTQCEGMADCGGHRGGLCPPCRARAILRDAGVIP